MKLLIIAFITDTFRPPHYSTFWMWRNDKGIFIICLFMEFAFPIPRRVLFIFFCWILFLAVLYTWEPTSHLFNHPSPPPPNTHTSILKAHSFDDDWGRRDGETGDRSSSSKFFAALWCDEIYFIIYHFTRDTAQNIYMSIPSLALQPALLYHWESATLSINAEVGI